MSYGVESESRESTGTAQVYVAARQRTFERSGISAPGCFWLSYYTFFFPVGAEERFRVSLRFCTTMPTINHFRNFRVSEATSFRFLPYDFAILEIYVYKPFQLLKVMNRCFLVQMKINDFINFCA